MKTRTAGMLLAITATLQTVAPAPAKDKPAFERGVQLQMDSTHCGYAEKGGKTLTGEILGKDGQHKSTQVMPGIRSRVQPADLSHPA